MSEDDLAGAGHRLSQSRRRFLGRMSIALSVAAGAVVGVPIVAYLLSPLIQPTPDVWTSLGPVGNFKAGTTVLVNFQDPSPVQWAGLTAATAAWVRRGQTSENDFTAFAVNCTHLGCPVRWVDTANLFLCPCHGGVYYADGNVAAGPPPRPLFQYQARVQNGELQILTRPLPVA